MPMRIAVIVIIRDGYATAATVDRWLPPQPAFDGSPATGHASIPTICNLTLGEFSTLLFVS